MPANEPPKPTSETPGAPQARLTTAASVRDWLVTAVAEAAGLDPSAVDPHRPVAELGLGSRQLVALSVELAALTGRTLDPSLVYNHPTIAAIAAAVLDDEPPAAAAGAPPGPERQPGGGDIAILSMACRYPGGADDPEALWRLLEAGRDAVTEVPPGRWDTAGLHDPDPEAVGTAYTLSGGYLAAIDRFDAAFFGISPREAAAMDPQQRLLLATAWEAVERAGIVPGTLDGTSTGVYVGLYDSGYLGSAPLDRLDGHVGTGTAPSVASGRIAYTLGLQGPAVTVDTACSSSLVALHLAARALAAGECDLALAGGATLLVTPRGHVEFSRLRGLSPTGRCSPFGAGADGVVWAEGCGVVLLKRLQDARRDGDRVLAVVKGSAVNQDGRSQGLSAPSGLAQERVVRAALAAAGLRPDDLDHVEAHGTGTELGDPVEGRALAAVFGPDRPADRPLAVGSLKSNIGHTQAAAGIGGVIKTVLALGHERLPASLHAETPTPLVDWEAGGLRVQTAARPWPRDADRVRRAGVSAFGISGTNAHVVLEEPPGEPAGPAAADPPRHPAGAVRQPAGAVQQPAGAVRREASAEAPAPHPGPAAPLLFPLSARTEPALRGQAARLLDRLTAAPAPELPAVAAALAHHRTHFEHRAVIRAADHDGLRTALRALADGRPGPADLVVGPGRRAAGKVAFVFPGQGAQWPGMARDLLGRDPVFTDMIDRCDAALRPFTGWSVTAVLRGDAHAPPPDRVDVVQPVLFAVMVSLAAVWRARGVHPDAVVGHSQGEVAAACVAGALSLNDAAAVVALRSRALTRLAGSGTMAVVALPRDEVEALLPASGGRVSVAAVNSGRSTVVSGAAEPLLDLLAGLEREQVFVRLLDVDYASHSAGVEPVRAEILDELDGVTAVPAPVAWYSTVTGEPVTAELDAGYWYTNLREPVRFAPAVARMAADGYRCFVELSPHPSLLTALRTVAEETGQEDLTAVGSLRRDEDGPACLDLAAAELHVHGRQLDWRRLVPDGPSADLPTYAWDARRHWTEPDAAGGATGLLDRAAHPLLGVQLQSADESRWTFRSEWQAATADWLPDHAVFGRTVVSGTTLAELCRAALEVARPADPCDVADLLLLAPLVLTDGGTVEVSVDVVTAGAETGAGAGAEITVHSRPRGDETAGWTLHATATATTAADPAAAGAPPAWPQDAATAWAPDAYEALADRGLRYGPAFQGVRDAVALAPGEVLARLSLPAAAHATADAYPLHPALLDAALQATACLDAADGRVLLPVAVGRCVLPPGGATELTAHVRRLGGPRTDSGADVTLDVHLWDADGLPAGRLEGVRLRAADPDDLLRAPDSARHLYEVAWTPATGGTSALAGGTWAVRGDPGDPDAAAAVRALQAAGAEVTDARADVLLRWWPRPRPGADVASAAYAVAAAALRELQELLALPREEAPDRVVWVTRGAVAAADGDTVPDLPNSLLWGLARSARAEHPDVTLTLLDLDTPAGLIPALGHPGEPELAARDGILLTPRLTRAAAGPSAAQDRSASSGVLAGGDAGAVAGGPPAALGDFGSPGVPGVAGGGFDFATGGGGAAAAGAAGARTLGDSGGGFPMDGAVLVTGGLGAVGRRLARRMAERGVPRLVLTSRRGGADPRAAGIGAELAALGAEVEIVACDVADAADVAEVVRRAGRGDLPLRGIVHCAGVLADGVAAELTAERLAQVLRPKVDGAAHLHRLTAELPLRLFLLVSSAAGVFGAPGQANYAAANVFLDQLAHHRRALGLPAASVSFGAWAGEGLAARHADLARMARLGHRPLTADQGCELAELSLRAGAPHLVASALDLPRLRAAQAGAAEDAGALWRTLLPPARATRRGGDSLAERLARLPAADRAERVLALVREEATRSLGLGPGQTVRPDQPLRELGMDSVTALELRNRISSRVGARLPATLLFDHPTPARLAGYLLAHPLAAAARTAAPHATAPAAPATPALAADEPVAVVAMACRLPGGVKDPEGLWRLVAEGRDAVGPFPADRWDVASLYDPDPDAPGTTYAREGGFLEDIASFDAGFFGITPKEAAAMDPQQRLLLETAWEALERAGIVPAELAGSSTGVYVGMFGSDYLAGARLDQLDGYVGTGAAPSVASGRLAYALGLNGPALTVDTACSSSLVAVHLAAQALRAGECDLALTGGVTLMVTPQTFVEFSRLRGLSPTGRCRSFADAADGAVWAEGAGLVVLKRLRDARRDGDEVLAVLRGTAVNQDGRSQGLSAPNGPAQEQVVRQALARSGLAPADIDHVEAHGTGTTLGDPIEAHALAEVFGGSRPPGRPLHLGSLKSNVGHTQAASGVLGLIKVVQSLRHRTLPRTLHADPPSRHVDWDGSGLRLLHDEVAWPQDPGRTRRAGVSAFGISGTNAHVILEEAPYAAPAAGAEPAPDPRLFTLSGRSDDAVRAQAARLAAHLRDGAPVALPDIAHTLARHRSHFEWRAALVAAGRDELLAGLDALADGRRPLAAPRAEQNGRTAFVLTGHGGPWPPAGVAEAAAGSAAFREELARVDEAVRRRTGWSVRDVLAGTGDAPSSQRTDVVQPVLFALGAAQAAAWRGLGVTPDAVVGHSLGEVVAAYVAGALTLDDAVRVVTGRAAAAAPLVGLGGMLAVRLPRARVEDLLAPYAGRLFVAAVNSAEAAAVSGEAAALAALRRKLDELGTPNRPLATPFASHTPLMASARGELLTRLGAVRGGPGRLAMYSTVRAEPVAGEQLDAAYWYANLGEPVRFADTIRRMLHDGYRSFVEIGPHPSLGAPIEEVAAEAGIDVAGIAPPSADDGPRGLLHRLAELYGAGHTPDWRELFPAGRRADLPTYPYARERHWRTPARAATGAGLLGTHLDSSDAPGRHLFQTDIDLGDSRFAYLADHRVGGEVWLPAAAFLDMALEAAHAVGDPGGPDERGTGPAAGPLHLTGVRFHRPLRLEPGRPVRLQLVLHPAADGHRDFTIASAPAGGGPAVWEQHVTGRAAPGAGGQPIPAAAGRLADLREECTGHADLTAVRAALSALGIDHGPAFRALEQGRFSGGAALGRLAPRPAAGHLLHPAVLDAAFTTAALPGDAPAGRAFVPAEVGRLHFTGRRTPPAWATCRLRSAAGETATADLAVYDEDEHLVLYAEEFRLAALAPRSPLDAALFETRWQPRPDASARPAEGSWLLLADGTGVAAALGEKLAAARVPHVIARRGPQFAAEGPGRYVLDPADPGQWARLLDEAYPDRPPAQVVQLTALDAPAIVSAATAEDAAGLACLTTLHLVRALAGRTWQGGPPRLFVVVRGSQAAGGSTQVTRPEQALAWGFGLAVAQEHPELSATLIDLPPAGGTNALWTQLRCADGEHLVALRETGRLVPRLARTRPDDGGHGRVAPDGVYLVTGGLGGLGRVVAERLAARGARHLALLGRSTPGPEAAAWIGELAARGVRVHLVRADVADRDGLTAALDALRRDAGPVTGIVHAAGVLDDAVLDNLTGPRVLRVLAPKVLGTALLTELVPEAQDIVLFASVAGLLGSAGQSPYAAANAFLDAWAHHLALAGRRALSLDWGAWTEVGMAAGTGPGAAGAHRSGLAAFTAQEGGELFDRVLPTGRRQLAPAALDLEALALDPDAARTRPLLADLVTLLPGNGNGNGNGDGLARRVLAAATDTDRAAQLETYVRARVRDVSGGATAPGGIPAHASLTELGLDSLMFVRLRTAFSRELGVDLPTAAVMSAADVRGLAEALATALRERPSAAPGTTAEEPGRATPEPEVPEHEVRPATRDVVRLLRSARPGMPGAAHAIGLAVRLAAPTTREVLTGILERLAARHAALRTAVESGPGGGRRLRVDRRPAGPLLHATSAPPDTGAGPGPDAAASLRALLEPPFDLAATPLWRFALHDGGPDRDQLLVFGAHHAVSDLQSLLLVAAEIDAELSGTRLGGTVTNRDADLLAAAQPQPAGSTDDPGAAEWRALFQGSARLDLTLDRPRPARRTYRAGSVTVQIPDGLMDRVATTASGLAVTPAAFCLGALTVLLARLRERERFVLAVPVDTRVHADAYGAVGFFGVPVPFPAEARAGERVEEVLRRTGGRLERLLAKGAMFSDVLATLTRQGLHRPEAPLVEVYFNYVRSGAGRLTGLEVLPAGTGHSDLDLMVTMTPDAGRIRLDHNLDILDAASAGRLGEEFLRLLAETADDPAAPVRAASSAPAVDAVPAVGLDPAVGLGLAVAPDPAVGLEPPTAPAPEPPTAPAPEPPTAAAAAPATREVGATAPPTLALAATFALGDLPAMVAAATGGADPQGPAPTVTEAPYHQVLAALRDPSGVFADPAVSMGAVLLRAADLERFGPVGDDLLAELRTAYPAALRSLAERTRTPLVVGFLPAARDDDRLTGWERAVAADLADAPGIAVLGPEEWTRDHAVALPFDAATERLAHLPFTPQFQAAVALRLAGVAAVALRPAPKVIAVDGDETLWGGVAGEIGPAAVDLGGPRAALARRLLRWRAAGTLLVLVSNNDEDTVRAVLDRPESLLRAEHFSALSAAWEPKSRRLAAVARTLNLGLDSFLFLDDNPAEIAAMRAARPEVLSVTCPPAAGLDRFLDVLWPFVPPAATAEDALRARFYAQERERDAVREQEGFEEFLAGLRLAVDVRALTDTDVPRAEQLVHRTNQFTLGARSADGGDVARWRARGEVWTAAARDRFGDYGQIGLVAVRADGDVLDVLAWVMSCRALGRGVEERLLAWLADRAEAAGCTKVRLTAERTARNAPARRLLAALGGGDPDDEHLTVMATPEHLRGFRSWRQRGEERTS
ncbi:SDR family NAD(P)-dependent oxidoreductase [Streptomyces sp. CA2R106]|uniref:SDR family NAD(P)-dependent oxidoreductase n=1 Tax=Streptomyces sp. CA2R106 TaxID=3120153 RepID=UPI00300A9925